MISGLIQLSGFDEKPIDESNLLPSGTVRRGAYCQSGL